MSKCYKCDAEVPEGETECESCARGIPPGMRQMGEAMERAIHNIPVATIDWAKIKAMPVENRVDAVIDILSHAIPGVVHGSPQFFALLRYLKK